MASVGLSDSSMEELRVYPARWRMLAIYCFLGLFNQVMWLSFAPAPTATALRFDVPEESIAAIAYSCTALYLPGSWLCGKLLAESGLRRSVVMGCLLQVIGAVIRCLADVALRPVSQQLAFVCLFIGQGFSALASPAFMNTPAVLAEAWFSERERDGALAVGTMTPIFGQGVGSAIAGFVVTGARGEGTSQLLFGQALATLLASAWAVCAFQDKPPTPPSRAAEAALALNQENSAAQPSTLATWGKLLCRPQFLLLLLIFNSGLGLAAAVLTLYGRFTELCGYKSSVAGAASGLYMLGGVVGALVAGSLMGITKAYRSALRISVSLAVLTGIIFLATLRPDMLVQLLITTTVFGGCMMSALPVLIGNATEETFPVPADAATGLMQVSAIALQVFFTPLVQAVLTLDGDTCGDLTAPSRVFLTAVAVFGCFIPALAYRGRPNRTLAEMACNINHVGCGS